MSCSEVSAAASRFALPMAGNQSSSISMMYRTGACGRISSRVNRLWSWPERLPEWNGKRRHEHENSPLTGRIPIPKRQPVSSWRSPTPRRLCRTAGSISRRSTRHFCIGKAQRQPNTRLASTWRSPAAVWCFMRAARSSGSGRWAPICSIDSLQAPDYLAIRGLTRTARNANAERIRA